MIKIVKLDWDHDVEKSDEELRTIGRKNQTVCQHLVEPEAVGSQQKVHKYGQSFEV